MTSQKYIQSLIDDIDAILPKAEARLPWSKPGDVAAQRRVLERVRSYLVSEQQNLVASPENPPVLATPEQQEVLQQIVQAVTQEMDVMRVNLMQPLQAEVEALHQQRDSLVQEIRQLERTKQQLDSITYQKTNEQEFISELSQGLIKRCSENLTQQLSQILANWEVRLANMESSEAIASAPFNQTNVGSAMHPHDRLEQLRQIQEQSDRLLTNLDANQRALFEALQRNLQGYQESLSQGLDKMHRLGVQGEMLFTALVNRLAQQLGREASTLLQSSLQLSDSPRQPNETATSQTTPETLLPTNALKVTESSTSNAQQLTRLPNPLPEAQTTLQPLQSVEQLNTEQASALSAAEVQQKIPDATAMPPLTPQTDELQSPAETRSQRLDAQSLPMAQGNWLENLNSQEWEIIEGLDFGNLDFDSDDSGVETFIQLDINSQASLPFVDERMTPSPSDTQEQDSLSNILNEQLPTVTPSSEQIRAGEVEALDEPHEAAELDFSSDSHRQEIDELYETLFGTNALSGEVLLDESDSETDAESDVPQQKTTPTDVQILRDDEFSNTDLVHSLSPQVEDVLFEGLVDPAAEPPQPHSLDDSTQQFAQSWEALFFEDSVAGAATETDLAGKVKESSLLNNSLSESQNASDQEGIKTIAALTDLFEEMGLSHSLPIVEADLLPVTTEERSQNQISETDPQVSLVEDTYIPASPEENLLLTDELETEPDREILLDENILQKLSEDLFSFEESESQNFPIQENQSSPTNDIESLPVAPDTDRANQENWRFPMWEELLAEDWEEFTPNDWSEQASMSENLEIESTTDLSVQEPVEIDINEEKGAIGSAEEEILNNSTLTALESLESDSDPDVFLSDILELDQEDADVNEAVATQEAPEDLAGKDCLPARSDAEGYGSRASDRAQALGTSDLTRHEALNVFEDEAFVEMLWEEQIDSTIEEMISSPELEFDSDFFLQEAPGSQLDSALNLDEEAFSKNAQGKSLNYTQDAILPTQRLDDELDTTSQERLEFQQEDELISENKALSEHQQSDNLNQEGQTLDKSKFERNVPQPNRLNPDQSDNSPKKGSDSNSEANP